MTAGVLFPLTELMESHHLSSTRQTSRWARRKPFPAPFPNGSCVGTFFKILRSPGFQGPMWGCG